MSIMGQAAPKGIERCIDLPCRAWSIFFATFNLHDTKLFVFYPKHFPQLTKLNLYYRSQNCVEKSP